MLKLRRIFYPVKNISGDERLIRRFRMYAFWHNLRIKVNEPIEAKRLSSLWYGGTVITVKDKKSDKFVEIVANGDVRATLYNKPIAYKDSVETACVKDTGNHSGFWFEMNQYIKSDKELWEMAKDKQLILDDMNWWECFPDRYSNTFEYPESFIPDTDDNLEKVVAYVCCNFHSFFDSEESSEINEER